MKTILQAFRYFINFIEKFVKNFFVLVKSLFVRMKQLHSYLLRLHATPKEIHIYGYATVIIVLGVCLLVPVIIWAGLKSV